MGKIPVGRTLGETLNFVFRRYGALFGTAWLPLLVLCGIYYFTFVPIIRETMQAAQEAARHATARPIPPNFASFRFFELAYPLVIATSVWMRVGITKAALDLKRTFRFAYVAVGMDELRVIGGELVVISIFYAAAFATAAVVAAIAAVVGALVSGGAFTQPQLATLTPWAIGAAIACAVTLLVAAFYVLARLLYFFVPATIMERRLGFRRSWELGKGNVWRIFVIMVTALLIALVLELAVGVLVGVPAVFAMTAVFPAAGHNAAAVSAVLWPYALLLLATLVVLFYPLLVGLQIAPSAFAYRAITKRPEDDADPASRSTPDLLGRQNT